MEHISIQPMLFWTCASIMMLHAPACHQIPVVSPKCSTGGEGSGALNSSPEHFSQESHYIHDEMIVASPGSYWSKQYSWLCTRRWCVDCHEHWRDIQRWNNGYVSRHQCIDILFCWEGLIILETPQHQPKVQPWLKVGLYHQTNCG